MPRPGISQGLPTADAAGVDMDELRLRVEADAAGPEREGGIAQVREPDIGQPDVDCAPFEMEAPAGDSAAPLAERLVGRGRTVAGDHFEWRFRAGDRRKRVQLIEQRRIDRMRFAVAEIAQEPVD